MIFLPLDSKMYHFTIYNVPCSCDTLAELVAVCRFGPQSDDSPVSDLPVIQGRITTQVVRKIAKSSGRTDLRQVRRDLKERQALG